MKFVHVLPNIDYSNRGGVSKKKPDYIKIGLISSKQAQLFLLSKEFIFTILSNL